MGRWEKKRCAWQRLTVGGLLFVAVQVGGGLAQAAVTEYVIPASSDYSGPYADIMESWDGGRQACATWWNNEVGSRVGVRVRLQTYDSRYDAAVVAATYPRMLSQYRPVAWLGLGGPDVAALQERIPQDRLPLIMSTGSYGYGWRPNNWVVQPRPTYVHEYAGFMAWVLGRWRQSRPVRVGILNAQLGPYLDWERGLTKYFETHLKPAGKAEIVRIEYSDPIPVDVSSQVSRIVAARPDYLFVFTNVPMVVATLNALEQWGTRIPMVMSSHNGLSASARALGGFERLEGSYDVYAYVSDTDRSLPAVTQAWERYGRGTPWTIDALQGCAQALLLGAGMRRAAEAVGPDRITGQALYDVFADAFIPASEMLGLTSDLRFTHQQPFPHDPKVRISTVQDGRHIPATQDWIAVPFVDKW